MTDKSKEHLFLIYLYEFYGEKDAKLYNELHAQNREYPRDFENYTEKENMDYLMRWKKLNGIRVGDFKIYIPPTFNQYGTPIFIKRVRGEYKECIYESEKGDKQA